MLKTGTGSTGPAGGIRGFTLVEMLVVLGITSILVSLLMAPLVSSFRITERTQVNVRSQGAARQILERLTREIQTAIFVYDNTGAAINIPIPNSAGSIVNFQVPYAMVDLVPPKLMMHCNDPDHPAGEPRDYPRGDLAWPACPHDGSLDVESRPITPLEADSMVVRYFIGLQDPDQPYSNGHVNKLALASQINNTFVLYRAEYSPYDADLFERGPDGSLNRRDPNFFYGPLRQNWKRIAQVVGPVKDTDLVSVEYDGSGNPVSVFANIRFEPNIVTNDVLTPTDPGRTAAGEPSSPPTAYRATSGHWAGRFQVRVYRNNFQAVYYTGWSPGGDLMIYRAGDNQPVFNITAWQYSRQISPDPNPEMMFTVDADKGEVSFAFPFTDTWPSDAIADMNADFAQAYAENPGLARRSILLPGFQDFAGSAFARIIPGSERVTGPDWNAGPGFGQAVQYTMVPSLAADPGPNQYRIDYRTGEITFHSRPHPPMPEGAGLEVKYSIQNNQGFDPNTGDILSVDYQTKNVLSVQVGYRIFDDRGKPQGLTVASNVPIRNFHR